MDDTMLDRQQRRTTDARSDDILSDGELSDDSLEFVVGGLQRVWTGPGMQLSGTMSADGVPSAPGTPLLS